METSHLGPEFGVFVTLGVLLLVVLVFAALFRGKPQEPPNDNAEIEKAIRLLQKPRLGPGNRWFNFKVTIQECDQQIQSAELKKTRE